MSRSNVRRARMMGVGLVSHRPHAVFVEGVSSGGGKEPGSGRHSLTGHETKVVGSSAQRGSPCDRRSTCPNKPGKRFMAGEYGKAAPKGRPKNCAPGAARWQR